VGALGTTMPGTPVAHVATGTIPAAVTISSVFVVVFPILWFSGRFSPIQKGKPMNHEGQIYHSHGRALGDVLASTMLYLRWSQENEQPLKMSTWYFKGRKKEYSYKLHEILELFTPEQTAKLIITDEKPTMRHSSDEGIDQIFQRIKYKWHPSNVASKIIAYQFDGKHHKAKNFPNQEAEQDVLNYINQLGYQTIKLGKEKSLNECAKILSYSFSFVGVPSGMSVLSAAVGIPYIVITHKLGQEWLKRVKYGPFIVCQDGNEYKQIIKDYHEKGLKYFQQKCINQDNWTEWLKTL